ncbi:unnamed protein product [Ambrosiozyma monospora]|uniref:Unnamed protein product n=1 Tax=Ambrosiozyma monospora TaxID=43982 RepID=A0ACB5TR21_AMBMO|nr:unnamed protein product [Ambrosiozyma monospora]
MPWNYNNSVPKLLDTTSSPESVPNRLHKEDNYSKFHNARPTTSHGIKIITIPEDISKSQLPNKQLFDGSSADNSPAKLSPVSSTIGSGTAHGPSDEESDPKLQLDNDNDNDNSNVSGGHESDVPTTPATFPVDHQILNMNDISSPSLVVAQNFENYCRVVLLPSFSAITSSSFYNSNNNNSNSNNSTSTSNSSTSLNSLLSPFRYRLSPYSEKKLKDFSNRAQQPIWSFLNAARTMFSRLDLYSGDYYQHNALVTTGGDKYGRNLMDTVQCFVYYIGETDIVFLLQNIYYSDLMIKVNGIIWEQLSFVHQFQEELIIVNGIVGFSNGQYGS